MLTRGRVVLAGLFALTLCGGGVLLTVSSDLLGHVPAVSGTVSADPSQVAVVDGETLRLKQTVVRLSGVTAPPRGQACGGQDCGAASSEALAGLVRNHAVSCQLKSRDASGLARADCDAAGVDLNRAQVKAGWARARGRAASLHEAEAQARDAGRGIWSQGGAPSF